MFLYKYLQVVDVLRKFGKKLQVCLCLDYIYYKFVTFQAKIFKDCAYQKCVRFDR